MVYDANAVSINAVVPLGILARLLHIAALPALFSRQMLSVVGSFPFHIT
jgi:hypothetical protein